ncbi:hypothetical protein D9758_011444 [Tetrapyrgos nigripes]|uniref:Uncharacterized protein n=1 Tax=Tetrapyrgos nigripes TaxID=182062 RepID=A0A8H5FR98_9AGAR|nr:hypothetical protein D9758_011444 [Tetrapyrgos nigripes]
MDRPTIDEATLRRARDTLCMIWSILSLCERQEKAGRNIIQGISTMYDVPTGGGKTLSVILVISPLNALMDAQVKDLLDKGIQAVVLNSSSKAQELFEEITMDPIQPPTRRLKHQVILTSPECEDREKSYFF